MKEGESKGLDWSLGVGSFVVRSGFDLPKVVRIPELDLLRGIAIVGVLVLHSSFQDRFTKETLAVQGALARLFDWSVLAFFFSSGFLHNHSTPVATALRKRFMTLLLPFFFYNALYNLCFASTGALGLAVKGNFKLSSELLVTGLFVSPAFQLYFLPWLFVISVGISGVDRLTRPYHRLGHGILLLLAVAFYSFHGYPDVSHGPALDKLPLYVAAFLTGVIARPCLDRRPAKAWLIAASLAGVLGVLVLSRLPVVSLAVPPLLAGLFASIPKVTHSKVLISLGTMSGCIYLWHTPLLLPGFTRLLIHCGVPSLLVLFGALGLTLASCFFLRVGLDVFFGQVLKRNIPRFITL